MANVAFFFFFSAGTQIGWKCELQRTASALCKRRAKFSKTTAVIKGKYYNHTQLKLAFHTIKIVSARRKKIQSSKREEGKNAKNGTVKWNEITQELWIIIDFLKL